MSRCGEKKISESKFGKPIKVINHSVSVPARLNQSSRYIFPFPCRRQSPTSLLLVTRYSSLVTPSPAAGSPLLTPYSLLLTSPFSPARHSLLVTCHFLPCRRQPTPYSLLLPSLLLVTCHSSLVTCYLSPLDSYRQNNHRNPLPIKLPLHGKHYIVMQPSC